MNESEMFSIWNSLYSKAESTRVRNWWLSLAESERLVILKIFSAKMGGKL